MDGYEVLSGELDTHAGKVDGLTDRLRTATDAARQVTMNGTVQQGVDALVETARKVRDTAQAYTTTETGEASQYRGMEGAL
jgi:hypothetical protein